MAFVLQLLGEFHLASDDGKPVPLPDRARAMLAYLAIADSPVSRQALADLLSEEGTEQDQRAVLRQALYVVRKATADGDVICAREDALFLNDKLVSADVRPFRQALARRDDQSLAEAIVLYRGSFLEGEKSPSPAYEDWLAACRAEFLEQALGALLKLASAETAAGRHETALAYARRALSLDQLREDSHRQIMHSLAALGQRSAALRHYEVARQLLSTELGVEPEGETEDLRKSIACAARRDSAGSTAAVFAAPPDAGEERATTDHLNTATHNRSGMARAYLWMLGPKGGAPTVRRLSLAIGIISFLVLGFGLLFLLQPLHLPPRDGAPMAVLPRLSIVVLPFNNLSGDPNQEYLADGITDDLTTDLSRIDGSFVIARPTAFTYKNRQGVDVRDVGHELGVRYVLEGSVRQAGEQVDVSARLIDAATAEEVWTERITGTRSDLTNLHDEVTGRIAATLRLEMVETEGRRVEQDQRTDPAAADDALRAWAILYRPYSRESTAAARRLFERAIAKDPNTVSALVGLAQVLEGYSNSPVEDHQRADGLLRRALDLDPNRAQTHFVLGMIRRSQGRLPEAVEAFQTAIALDRNYARAYLYLGLTQALLGHPEEAITLAQHAMRLSPRDPNIADYYWIIGLAQNLLGRTDEAIENLQKACAANPRLWYMHMELAAAYGLAMRIDDAKRELAEQLRLRPEFTSLAAITAASPQANSPAYVAMAERTTFLGLRRAGFPDGGDMIRSNYRAHE